MVDSSPVLSSTKPAKSRRREWIFLVALLVFAIGLRLNVRQGQISGASMEPSYADGSIGLVWKTAPRARLKAGDVIIFRDSRGEELIKCIALIRAWNPTVPTGNWPHPNGGRLIPFSLLFGSYFQRVASGQRTRPQPQNTIYVLGDNLVDSDDSRSFGPIRPNQILGKVIPQNGG